MHQSRVYWEIFEDFHFAFPFLPCIYHTQSTKAQQKGDNNELYSLVLVRGMVTIFFPPLRPFISFFSLPRMFVFVSRTPVSTFFLKWTPVTFFSLLRMFVFVGRTPVSMFFLRWTPVMVTTTPLHRALSTWVVITMTWTPIMPFLNVHWTSESIFRLVPVPVIRSPSVAMRVFFPVWKAPFTSRRRWHLYL